MRILNEKNQELGETNKHAYLIIVHKADYIFEQLIKLIDDIRNDIYIHMDAKNDSYNEKNTIGLVRFSKVFHTKRTDVIWGGYSLINAEMLLLKEATQRKYQYYHLVSGQCLPIKTQDYIHCFFEKNYGYEFLEYEKSSFCWKERVRYYYPLQEIIGKGGKGKYLYQVLGKLFLIVQICFGVNRNKDINFQKGSQWFSITDSFARFVVENETKIQKLFSNTFCCDEVFLQTLALNSIYGQRLWGGLGDNLRLIDWERGKPYTWRNDDAGEIRESNKLFARKFDSDIDVNIIDLIVKELLYNSNLGNSKEVG